jgi:hypothetical protein
MPERADPKKNRECENADWIPQQLLKGPCLGNINGAMQFAEGKASAWSLMQEVGIHAQKEAGNDGRYGYIDDAERQ